MAFVLAKDWYEDRAAVLDRLACLLAGDEEPEEDEEQPDEGNLETEWDTEQFQAEAVALKVDSLVQPMAESEATVEASETPPPEAADTSQDSAARPATPTEVTVVESSATIRVCQRKLKQVLGNHSYRSAAHSAVRPHRQYGPKRQQDLRE